MYTPQQLMKTGKAIAKDPVLRWSILFFLAVLLGIAILGCSRQKQEKPEFDHDLMPYSGMRFTLLVADERLAMAIDSLASDWLAQTESKLIVLTASEKDILEANALDADAAIIPLNLIGALAEKGVISPLSENGLQEYEHEWAEVFQRCRLPEATWNGKQMGVPFGAPVFTVYYRADIFEKLGKSPPRTWEEYQALAAYLHNRENCAGLAPDSPMPWAGTIEPLDDGWAGLVLLARAAAYWEDSARKSPLFNLETMEPRIAEPPMTRALTELAATQAFGPENPRTYTPDNTREAFWLGECAMALSWPTAAVEFGRIFQNHAVAGFSELPGATHFHDPIEKTWKQRPDGSASYAPLLGISGRVGVVGALTRNREGTTKLLLWLATGAWRTPPSSKTTATTLYSASQLQAPERWVESLASESAAQQYAALTQKTLSRNTWSLVLRIPGRAEYLAALDQAVRAVVDDDVDPQTALDTAAEEWRRITKRYGVDSQRKAYLADQADR